MGLMRKQIFIQIFFLIMAFSAIAEDFIVEGVYEAALDLPRILFLLKRTPAGNPLEYEGQFELNWAFLDTGASGILLSRETIEVLEISLEPGAQYADVGVGGYEYFNISEPLYLGTIAYDDPYPENPGRYMMHQQWRFQVSREYAEWPMEPLDVIGMPAMAGKVAVLDPTKLSLLEDYFIADIKEANDPLIPAVDINIALRFEKYITPESTENIPPLPVLAYNPVIDGITVQYNGNSSTGNFLLDTGGMISIISTAHAIQLGLMNEDGEPIVPVDFAVPIGGIGGQVELPGFEIDSLSVPTLNGYNIVFIAPRVCVHDIGYVKPDGETVIIDGIFGSNFLCASMNMDTWDLSDTPFNRIVIDMANAKLGFDVKNEYPLPSNPPLPPWPYGDINRDWSVDIYDYAIIAEYWLNSCDWLNWNCLGSDMNRDGTANFIDHAVLANHLSAP